MDIHQALDALVAAMRPVLPQIVDVKTYPGRFDLAELKAVSAKAPAIRVTWLSSSDSPSNSGFTLDVNFAAFIITKPTKTSTAQQAGAVIATTLQAFLARLTPRKDGDLGAPTRVASNNLYARAIAEEGVHLIGVTWSQTVDLGLDIPVSGDPMGIFQKFFADYDLTPVEGDIAASDHVLLPGAPA